MKRTYRNPEPPLSNVTPAKQAAVESDVVVEAEPIAQFGECRECRYWRKASSLNPFYGRCIVASATLSKVTTDGGLMGGPPSQRPRAVYVGLVNCWTTEDFGCRAFEPVQ